MNFLEWYTLSKLSIFYTNSVIYCSARNTEINSLVSFTIKLEEENLCKEILSSYWCTFTFYSAEIVDWQWIETLDWNYVKAPLI